MAKLKLLAFQTKKNEWLALAAAEFQKKVSGFIAFEIQTLKPLKLPRADAHEKKLRESQVIAHALRADERFYLFDERGKQYNSIGFSQFLSREIESGAKSTTFVLGGPYGFSDELKSQANGLISLSQLTFSHHVAQIVVLEQIYRALTIRQGVPYHNE